MKKRSIFSFLTVLLSIYVMLIFPACSTVDEEPDAPEYELNVVVGEGVGGTPVEGTYPYNEGDTVDYSYQLLDNYKNLSVLLDNDVVSASGTITITGVHNLKALADPIYVITGNWNLSEEYDDGSTFEVLLTFTGSQESGTVVDSDGGEGQYAVDEYNAVEFTLEFDDITYEYEGRFDDASNMSGTCKKISGSSTSYGYWTAIKAETSQSAPAGSGKKYSKEIKNR